MEVFTLIACHDKLLLKCFGKSRYMGLLNLKAMFPPLCWRQC